MDRIFFALGSAFAFLGVAAGAFAAHALKSRLSSDMYDVFQTGAEYQMYAALALLATAWATTRWTGGLTTAAGWLLVAGIVLFSGSLYALATSGVKVLGAVTPLGGLCFLAAFASLAVAALRS